MRKAGLKYCLEKSVHVYVRVCVCVSVFVVNQDLTVFLPVSIKLISLNTIFLVSLLYSLLLLLSFVSPHQMLFITSCPETFHISVIPFLKSP